MARWVEPHLLEVVEVCEILESRPQVGNADTVAARETQSLLQSGLLDGSRVLGSQIVEPEGSEWNNGRQRSSCATPHSCQSLNRCIVTPGDERIHLALGEIQDREGLHVGDDQTVFLMQ